MNRVIQWCRTPCGMNRAWAIALAVVSFSGWFFVALLADELRVSRANETSLTNQAQMAVEQTHRIHTP